MNFNLTTQMLGMLSFGSAAACCGFAWRRTGGGSWGRLMLLCIALAVEVRLQIRHDVSAHLRSLLRQSGVYHERAGPQVVLVLLLACVMLAGWLVLRRPAPADGAVRMGALASLCGLVLFGLETISLHGVEAVLYRPAGTAFIIGWIWAALGLLVSLAALRACRTAGPSI